MSKLQHHRIFRLPLWATLALLVLPLAGCSISTIYDTSQLGQPGSREPDSVPDAVPRAEPKSRYGNPYSYVVLGQRYFVMDSAAGFTERGIASWYGTKFHGRKTSSGEIYDMYGMTAAHKGLPLPTFARVTNLENGRQVVVRINDRGPFHQNRIIDLSYTAAYKLGMIAKGTAMVEIEAITPGAPLPSTADTRLASATNSRPTPLLFLQAGAFGSQDNARRLKARLAQSLNAEIRIEEASKDSQVFYRVQLGPLASVEQLDSLAQKLRELGLKELGLGEPTVVIR